MEKKKPYTLEDIRAEWEKLNPYLTLDGEPLEFKSDGEHSVEKYLERLEAKKKAAQNKSDM